MILSSLVQNPSQPGKIQVASTRLINKNSFVLFCCQRKVYATIKRNLLLGAEGGWWC